MMQLSDAMGSWIRAGGARRRGVQMTAVVAGLSMTAVSAYLVVHGLWFVPLAALGAVPAFLLLHRYPLAGVMIWLLVSPFVVDDTGGALRKVYWLAHRALPLVVLIMLIVARNLGLRDRPFPRLGRAELAMLAYAAISLLSVMYLAQDGRAFYELYDRVLAPMMLYLIVRLCAPDEEDLRRFVPVIVFLLASQAIFGLLSWVAPQLLPANWLDRAGERTTGSLDLVGVYGTTMVFCGLLLLQAGWHTRRRLHRWLLLACPMIAAWMIFMTLSRAVWLAGVVAFAGVLFLYPGLIRRILVIVLPLLFVVLSVGLVDDTVESANTRFLSDASVESALSRLPVTIAALRMFQEKPLSGFGYGNFEFFDRDFQETIPGVVVPDQDHASHNLYLTMLAEQGLPGLLLYLAPALLWLLKLRGAFRNLSWTNVRSRTLLILLWLVLASHVVVNNFANMRSPFGLGVWWVTLGLIGVITERALRSDDEESDNSAIQVASAG